MEECSERYVVRLDGLADSHTVDTRDTQPKALMALDVSNTRVKWLPNNNNPLSGTKQ